MTNLNRLNPFLCQMRTLNMYQTSRVVCTRVSDTLDEATKNEPETSKVALEADELVEPTTCCMSGCANCVWIQYAEKLSKLLEGSDKDVAEMVLNKVQDPNMRAFLSLELRHRKQDG